MKKIYDDSQFIVQKVLTIHTMVFRIRKIKKSTETDGTFFKTKQKNDIYISLQTTT